MAVTARRLAQEVARKAAGTPVLRCLDAWHLMLQVILERARLQAYQDAQPNLAADPGLHDLPREKTAHEHLHQKEFARWTFQLTPALAGLLRSLA